MINKKVIKGFSKFSKDQKIDLITSAFSDQEEAKMLLESFWHPSEDVQKVFDEFSENTLSNFYFPFGVAPNFLINGQMFVVPMVIEESSVVAAAANSARFWADRGGFRSRIIAATKIGHVHFLWNGSEEVLRNAFPKLRTLMIEQVKPHVINMEKRGGGILDIELVNKTSALENYFQIHASFDTRDAMGANFINTCLEDFADVLRNHLHQNPAYGGHDCTVIMSILSNYTPDCLVETYVQCPIADLQGVDDSISADEFAMKFEKAVQIAKVDVYRATTHNKGIFNGIDAVALATGNDFRAIEACGHTYAARNGAYQGLTDIDLSNGMFKYTLTIPLALGSVGGLTNLHPMARFSLELMGNPSAEELMMITASAGLANNFGALKSLTTKGIQKGHMKMHLLNLLNAHGASDEEKEQAIEYFKTHKVSSRNVSNFLSKIRVEVLNHS